MDPLTISHVAISLVGIAAGFFVVSELFRGVRHEQGTMVFLAATALTSLSGFLFPYRGVTPGIIFGILSVVVLAVAVYAKYSRKLDGGWRRTYLVTAMLAQYLNCFVLVAQSFQKVPFLRELAPTQADPPFAIAQLMLLGSFCYLGYKADGKSREISGGKVMAAGA